MDKTTEFNKLLYWISFWIVHAFYKATWNGQIQGLKNIPRTGACIFASNHASHLDPPLLGCNVNRIMTYFARKTLWLPGFMSWWLDSVGTIPVDRDGEADIQAMKRTLGALKEGKLLALFPEGTRTPDGTLQMAKPGIGLIAARSQAPVVPCRIFGTYKAFAKGSKRPLLHTSVDVVYGKPLWADQYDPGRAADRERYAVIAGRIMDAIRALPRPREKVV